VRRPRVLPRSSRRLVITASAVTVTACTLLGGGAAQAGTSGPVGAPPVPGTSTTGSMLRPAEAASCHALEGMLTDDQASTAAQLAAIVDGRAGATPATGRLEDTLAQAVPLTLALDGLRDLEADIRLRCGLLDVAEAAHGVDTRFGMGVVVPADIPLDSWTAPVAGAVVSGFGYRIHPVTGEERLHTGVDIDADEGEVVHPVAAGVVIWAGEANGYGNLVILAHPAGLATLYGHLSRIDVVVGDRVTRNDVVGAIGSTGLSTGSHLHLEVRVDGEPVEPSRYVHVG
jgi:murein DD-endopeptidase MepM/ murein hydrolase activator NlpD